ncbi:hypothetical protein [Salinimicrobium xinjiangense]|uniref:hypothetical protein n=1 Tax=Salinimicrobium xinjiangense TaxID=438596 RepID=UPI00040D33DC|nr:hypothetical protein [Salinimicrobium xinjiangense]
MKIRNVYKHLVIFGFAILTSATALSQNPIQPEPSRELEKTARETTEMWEEELSLTAKQMSLMEDKFIEFAIKRNRILQSKMREEVKTRKLIELKVLENKDMRDILTKPQYDRYLRLQKRQAKQEKKKASRKSDK